MRDEVFSAKKFNAFGYGVGSRTGNRLDRRPGMRLSTPAGPKAYAFGYGVGSRTGNRLDRGRGVALHYRGSKGSRLRLQNRPNEKALRNRRIRDFPVAQ